MNTQTIDLIIGGMHCGSCALGIQMLTSELDGVQSSFVDYEKKKGTITFDADKISKEKIVDQIKTLGYTAE